MSKEITKNYMKKPFTRPLQKYLKWSNVPVVILFIGALIRLAGYYSSAIRYDEAISLYRATVPFPKYLIDLQSYSSLFLWELILRFIGFFGNELWLIRLPAVFFGLITLWLSLKLMIKLGYSTIQRIFVSFIITLCPGLIWISQDARAYGLLVVIYLLSILFVFERKWLGLFALCGLSIYTHITGPAFAIGSFVFAIVSYPKEWKNLIFLGFAVAITWIPWGLLYINIQPTPQFIDIFWLEKLSVGFFFWHMIEAYFVRLINYPVLILFITTLIFSIILLIKHSILNPSKRIVVFLSPFLVFLLESLFWKNTLFYRTQITLIIPFAIYLGSIIVADRHKFLEWIMAGLWILVSLTGVLGWNPRIRGGNVDIAALDIRNKWQDGDVIYYGTGTSAMPFDYYLSDKPEFMLDGVTNSNLTPPALMNKFEFIALEKIEYKRAWIIFPADTFIPPEQMKRLKEYVKNGELIITVHVFQVPDIQVYLVYPKFDPIKP
jgi:hypothetical protein